MLDTSSASSCVYGQRRMRVSVIRQEFLELTGHHYRAILLNQLHYWTQKVKDFDSFLEEEKQRVPDIEMELRHGWIYKSAPDFIQETLLNVSKYTFYRHMRILIERGWVETKEHPTHPWDKTTFYRLNVDAVIRDLHEIGYELPSVFQESYQKVAETFMLHPETSMLQNATHNKITNKKKAKTKVNNNIDNTCLESVRAGARIINKEESQGQKMEIEQKKGNSQEISQSDSVHDVDSFIDVWRNTIKDSYPLTDKQKESFWAMIQECFNSSLEAWKSFCEEVSSHPQLNPVEEGKWRIDIRWISKVDNAWKIIQKFAEAPIHISSYAERLEKELREKCQEKVDGIQDPIWKGICTEVLNNWRPNHLMMKGIGGKKEDYEYFLKSRIWEYSLGDTFSNKHVSLYIPKEIPCFVNLSSESYYYQTALNWITRRNFNNKYIVVEQSKEKFVDGLIKATHELSEEEIEQLRTNFREAGMKEETIEDCIKNDLPEEERERLKSILRELEKGKNVNG